MLRRRRADEEQAPAPPGGPSAGSGAPSGSGAHPRKRGKFFITSREGVEICFKYQRNKCEGVCPQKRAHACQICLGSHPTRVCKEANKSGKGDAR